MRSCAPLVNAWSIHASTLVSTITTTSVTSTSSTIVIVVVVVAFVLVLVRTENRRRCDDVFSWKGRTFVLVTTTMQTFLNFLFALFLEFQKEDDSATHFVLLSSSSSSSLSPREEEEDCDVLDGDVLDDDGGGDNNDNDGEESRSFIDKEKALPPSGSSTARTFSCSCMCTTRSIILNG